MSIFGTIMSKIFHEAETVLQKPAATPASAPPSTPAPPSPSPQQAAAGVETTGVPAAASSAQPLSALAQAVDVEAVLTALASKKGGGGNWRTSIVDLLKLLDLDSSLTARKQLAQELDVHVGADGTAEENERLHKAVMQKLAENGGKVPDSLKS